MATLNPVIKKLLNDYCKSQIALNIPGKPAAVSGIQLGDIIEAAINHPQPGLDDATKKLLNDFSKTQPALNSPGIPAATSGIQLGDLLDQALLSTIAGSAMTDDLIALLNSFSKSQPALNLPGIPAATSGIQIGDLINDALTIIFYNVTYDPNGATDATALPVDLNDYEVGDSVIVAANTMLLTGMIANGWNTQADGLGTHYADLGALIIPTSNVTLFAEWVPTYNVTYDPNGATDATALPTDLNNYEAGDSVTVSANTMLLTGMIANGWNTQADGLGTHYNDLSTLTMPAADTTLFAEWI